MLKQKFILLGLCIISAQAFAQEEAQIFFATGSDFSVTTGNLRNDYKVADILDVPVERGGIVQTSAGSSVELRLANSDAQVKIVENTSAMFRDGIVDLVYGRMRAKTAENGELTVQSGDSKVFLSNAEAAFDFTMAPSTSGGGPGLILRVFVFSGSVNFKTGNIRDVEINASESLHVDASAQNSTPEKKPIEEEHQNYWDKNKFKDNETIAEQASPPEAPDSPETEAAPEVAEQVSPEPASPEAESTVQIRGPLDFSQEIAKLKKRNKLRNGLIWGGFTSVALGLGVSVLTEVFSDNSDMSEIVNISKKYYVGYGLIGLGSALTLLGLVIPSYIPVLEE
jgi:hypothetical protein